MTTSLVINNHGYTEGDVYGIIKIAAEHINKQVKIVILLPNMSYVNPASSTIII